MNVDTLLAGIWVMASTCWFVGSIYGAVQARKNRPNYDITTYVLSALTAPIAAPFALCFGLIALATLGLMFPIGKLVEWLTPKRAKRQGEVKR